MGDGEMKGNRIGIPKSRWKLGLKMAFGECFVFIKEAGTQVDIDKLYELDQLHSLYETEEGQRRNATCTRRQRAKTVKI